MKRRDEAYKLLSETAGMNNMPQLLRGAEVYLERNISELEDLPSLCITGTNYLLIEFPYQSFKEWMTEEIENITYKFSITPIIAHLDRYLPCFKKEDFQRILSDIEGIFQINNEALLSRSSLKFALKLIKEGFPVVLGSDTHNMNDRAPDFDKAFKVLKSKLGERDYNNFINRGVSYIENANE